jgi:hypothetical protein
MQGMKTAPSLRNENTNGHQSTRMPMRNPFRRTFWNLTGQMRLQKESSGVCGENEGEGGRSDSFTEGNEERKGGEVKSEK